MKKIISFFIMICCLASISSCSYDNFDEPKAMLTGKAVYDGEPVGLIPGWVCLAWFHSGVYCSRRKLCYKSVQW